MKRSFPILIAIIFVFLSACAPTELIDTPVPAETNTPESEETNPNSRELIGGHTHTQLVRSVAFSPDGSLLASGSDDTTIQLWDVATGEPVGEPLSGHRAMVLSVAFSPDGRLLASGSIDIRLYDVTTGEQVGEPLTGYDEPVALVNSVAFSPDGRMLASGDSKHRIWLWDVSTGQLVGEPLSGHIFDVWSVAFSPDGQLLASGSTDTTIRLWDVTSRQQIGEPLTVPGGAMSVVFSPDGSLLAGGGWAHTIWLWDVTTGEPVGEPLTGHTDSVNSVAFSPDGSLLASGSDDTTIRLWDVTTGEPVGEPLIGHTANVNSVAFSPDGSLLASGSYDATIRLWDVSTRDSTPILSATPEIIRPTATDLPKGSALVTNTIDELIGCESPCFQDFKLGSTSFSEVKEILPELVFLIRSYIYEGKHANSMVVNLLSGYSQPQHIPGEFEFIKTMFTFQNDILLYRHDFFEDVPTELSSASLIDLLGPPNRLKIVEEHFIVKIHLEFTEHKITAIYEIELYFDEAAMKAWICQDYPVRLKIRSFGDQMSGKLGKNNSVEFGELSNDLRKFLLGEQECVNLTPE